MQLAITNLSITDDLVLPYLEKVIKPGATLVFETPQFELCKMVDLQQAVVDGLAEYQVEPTAVELASGILTAGLPPSALLADVPKATSTSDGVQTAQGKRIEQQSYEDCAGQVANPATFNPAAFVAADVGLTTVAAGTRLFCQTAGGSCVAGVYVATSATAATLSNTGADAVQQGKKLKVTGLATGPVEYWQTAATGAGTAVFVESPAMQTVLWPPPAGDAGASLNTLMATEALRSNGPRTIVQTPGTYTYTTSAALLANTDLLTHADAVNVNAIATHSDPTNASLLAVPTYTTLTAVTNGAIAVGDNKLTLSPNANEVAVGDRLYLTNGLQRVYSFFVTKKAGAVLTIDGVFEDTFVTASAIVKMTDYPTNITVRGKGLFTGAGGARHIEIVGGYKCTVQDVNIDDSQGVPSGSCMISMDNGGYLNTLRNVTVLRNTPDTVSQNGIMFESQRHGTISKCKSVGFLRGALILDDWLSLIEDCEFCSRDPSGGTGMQLDTGGATSGVGCIGTVINRGTYGLKATATCGTSCIAIQAVKKCTLNDVTFWGCNSAAGSQLQVVSTLVGVDITVNNPVFKGAGSCKAIDVSANSNLKLRDGIIDVATDFGSGLAVNVAAGVTGFIDGLVTRGTMTQAIQNASSIPIRNCNLTAAAPITSGQAGFAEIDNCALTPAGFPAIRNFGGAASQLSVRACQTHLGTTGTAAVSMAGATTGATTYLESVVTDGGAGATGIIGKAACPIVVKTGNNLASCGTQYDATAIAAATHVVTAAGVS